jgi:membrane protein required for colicin V production
LIQDEPMRQVVAVGFAFLLTLIICMLTATIASSIVKSVGLGSIDRFLGAIYGFGRSCLLLVLFAMLAGLTSLPKTDMWQGSAVIPFAKIAVLAMQPYLPFGFAKRLNYRF